ncbi:hypothetical protein [uncultured Thiodictyon sp.]|uniref:hypothetical protein n=1 Tax=uncultured Thiodictyon sp. TaxID=1846217 RepID=UPI0025FF6DA1|nr:hypothetical protein [uncultured Thiodictyon sp.]
MTIRTSALLTAGLLAGLLLAGSLLPAHAGDGGKGKRTATATALWSPAPMALEARPTGV